MAVEIKLDQNIIDQIGRAAQDAAMATMEALHTEVVSQQVMPMKDGTLQNTLTSVQPLEQGKTGARLCADGPYPRFLYHGRLMLGDESESSFAAKGETKHTVDVMLRYNQTKNANARAFWWEPWLEGGEQEKFLPETFEKMLKERMP